MKNLLYTLILAASLTACKNENESVKTEVSIEKKSVQTFTNPAATSSQLPRLSSTGESLLFSWVTRKDSTDVLNYARYADSDWSEATEIAKGNDWFTNWADFPAIAESNGKILTSFLQKSGADTYTYDVKLNLFSPEENSWKRNFILHDDGTKSEHGFVTMLPYTGNSFMVTWLDGRETVGKEHGGGQMTLRAAIVFEDGSIDYDTLLDARVCDCCQTTAAIGPDDEIIVAYRDRSEEEIRDISVVNWTKEEGWSQPLTIGNDNWKIAGCPVNGPAMDIMGNTVAVAWFTAAKDEGDVNVAFSTDRGKTFDPSFRIDVGNATGRVDLVMLNEEEAAVLWMQPEGEDEVISLMKINKHGNTGHPITISKTSAERASGFPQLERLGDELFMAHTVLDDNGTPTITTLRIDIASLKE